MQTTPKPTWPAHRTVELESVTVGPGCNTYGFRFADKVYALAALASIDRSLGVRACQAVGRA